jgi:hypothetical protein
LRVVEGADPYRESTTLRNIGAAAKEKSHPKGWLFAR